MRLLVELMNRPMRRTEGACWLLGGVSSLGDEREGFERMNKEARGKWPKSACYFSKMSNFPVYGNRRGRPADGSLSGKQSSSFEMRGTAICPHTHAPLRRPLIPLCHWLMNCVTWGQPGNLFEMELSINVDKYLTRLAWVLSAIRPVKASSIVFGTQ